MRILVSNSVIAGECVDDEAGVKNTDGDDERAEDTE